jgi:hypothetical protein
MTPARLSSVTSEAAPRRRAIVRLLSKSGAKLFDASSSVAFQCLQSGVTDQRHSIQRRGVRSWDTRGLRQVRGSDSIPIDRAGPSV